VGEGERIYQIYMENVINKTVETDNKIKQGAVKKI